MLFRHSMNKLWIFKGYIVIMPLLGPKLSCTSYVHYRYNHLLIAELS